MQNHTAAVRLEWNKLTATQQEELTNKGIAWYNWPVKPKKLPPTFSPDIEPHNVHIKTEPMTYREVIRHYKLSPKLPSYTYAAMTGDLSKPGTGAFQKVVDKEVNFIMKELKRDLKKADRKYWKKYGSHFARTPPQGLSAVLGDIPVQTSPLVPAGKIFLMNPKDLKPYISDPSTKPAKTSQIVVDKAGVKLYHKGATIAAVLYDDLKKPHEKGGEKNMAFQPSNKVSVFQTASNVGATLGAALIAANKGTTGKINTTDKALEVFRCLRDEVFADLSKILAEEQANAPQKSYGGGGYSNGPAKSFTKEAAAEFVMPTGKHKGMTLAAIQADNPSYITFLANKASGQGIMADPKAAAKALLG